MPRALLRGLAALALAAAALAGAARADEPPVLRLAVLKFGTVNWLTETIVAEGLDRAAGYRLELVELAGKPATTIAFQAGDVDMIVTDWVWALGQRTDGADLRFSPYSGALGALVTAPGTGVGDLCDVEGRTVGVVGGELDKSWLVFEALAAERCGFDLAASTNALHGAAPLMSRQLETGSVDAVSTYWHYAARLEAAGMETVLEVDEAMEALGIAPAPPLVGFVWNAARSDPATVARFLASVGAAQAALRDDAAWERLKPLMRAGSDDEFRALRDRYRAGIPDRWTAADTAAAAGLHKVLAMTGGSAFRRGAGRFDPALFETPVPAPAPSGNDG